jgi:hypothetical protein
LLCDRQRFFLLPLIGVFGLTKFTFNEPLESQDFSSP